MGSSASAFAIESGNSFLVDKLGKKVAVDRFSVDDWGVYAHGLGGRVFDDEGMPTGKNEIIRDGIFSTMLHNSSTAKKFGKEKSTGNAGIIAPRPTSLAFSAGDIITRRNDPRDPRRALCDQQLVHAISKHAIRRVFYCPGDAAFRIQNGEIA